MPRPRLNPTEQQRLLVKQLAAVGISQEHIAHKIGVRSPKTLRMHFREELDLGLADANATIASALYQNAQDGNTDAQKFWLMNRAGWGRTNAFQPTLAAAPPFVIARDESSPPIEDPAPDPPETKSYKETK